MHVSITCTSCKRTLRIPDTAVGKLVKCPLCQSTFKAQAPAAAPPAPPPPPAPEPLFPNLQLDLDAPEPPPAPRPAGAPPPPPPPPPAPWPTSPPPAPPRPREEPAWVEPVEEPEPLEEVQPVEEEEPVEEVLPAERKPRPRRVRKARPVPAALPPWYLLALAALPLGLPILAGVGGWGVSLDPGQGVRLWLGFGTILAALALLWACLGKMPVGLRLGLSLGLTVVGYVVAILVYFGPGSAAAGSAAWREVRAPDGRFSVQMPGIARQQTVLQALHEGDVPIPIETYESAWRNTTFSLHHFELPPNEDADAFLRNYGQGIARRSPGATLRPEVPVWQGGHNGKEYVLLLPANRGTLVRRLFLVGRHVYLLSVSGPGASPNSPDVTRFFNSLWLR
jgi:hypothetical protein